MAVININQFSGCAPKMNSHSLRDNAATLAENCVLGFGDVRPLRESVEVYTVGRSGVKKTIFRIGLTHDESKYWLSWLNDVDVARSPIAGDASERIYWTGEDVPKMSNLALATSGAGEYPISSKRLGIPAPSHALTAEKISNATTGIDESIVYIYTFLNDLGEESAPSPPSSILTKFESDSVRLSNFSANPSPSEYAISSIRLYRSVSSQTGVGEYLFVDEIALETSSYVDLKKGSELAEPCPTLDYAMPPETMRGLVSMQNGMMAAFDGNDLLFCEPFLPYAWPEKYRLTVDYPIVGLAAFGQSLLVCTTGTPYLATGVDPSSMSLERVDLYQSCASKRSIVGIGSGAIYASPDGLVYVGAGGSRIITQLLYDHIQWRALNPSSIHAYLQDGRYIGFYTINGVQKGFILQNIMGDVPELSFFDSDASCGFSDPLTGELYLMSGNSIQRFDSGEMKKAKWRSKPFYTGDAITPSCSKIEADGYPVTFRFLKEGQVNYEFQIQSDSGFRLPPIRGQSFSIEIESIHRIRVLSLATSMLELRRS